MGRFDKDTVSIGRAAELLDVSINTIRRWDSTGRISSFRSTGGHRLFSTHELVKYKSTKPLTTTQAAKILGLSASTLRRLEGKGALKASHLPSGRLQFHQSELKKYQRNLVKPKFHHLSGIHSSNIHAQPSDLKSNPTPSPKTPSPYQLKPIYSFAIGSAIAGFIFVTLLSLLN